MRNLAIESAPGPTGALMQTSGADNLSAKQLSRRSFMRRGALLAAGGLVAATAAAGTVAIPGWARWLGEQMEKLQPKPRVEIREPAVTVWTFGHAPEIPEGPLDLSVLKEFLDKQRQAVGGLENPWEALGVDIAALTYTTNLWLGLKEA